MPWALAPHGLGLLEGNVIVGDQHGDIAEMVKEVDDDDGAV